MTPHGSPYNAVAAVRWAVAFVIGMLTAHPWTWLCLVPFCWHFWRTLGLIQRLVHWHVYREAVRNPYSAIATVPVHWAVAFVVGFVVAVPLGGLVFALTVGLSFGYIGYACDWSALRGKSDLTFNEEDPRYG